MNLHIKSSLALLLALAVFTTVFAQDTLTVENFENYIPGDGLCAQSPAGWVTWNNGPGTKEDPIVSEQQAFTGDQSLMITGTNDVVYDLGSKTSGRYELSFRFYVPGGKTGSFGIMQHADGVKSSWGFQCRLDAGSEGKVKAEGINHTFYFLYTTWNPVRVIVDLDNDHAEIYIREFLVAEWQWSKQFDGKDGQLELGALNFFAWNSDQRTPQFYVDEIVFSKLQAPPAPGNLTAEVTENDVKLNWDAPPGEAPLVYKVYRDGAIIAPLVSDTAYTDFDVYPGIYSYSVKALYESGLSYEAGPVEAIVEGGTERNFVLLEIATGTWCTYCPGSAMGADDLVNSGKKVAVIEYHDSDEYANTASDYRNNYYNVPGYPTAHFDGQHQVAEGSANQSMYPVYLPIYEEQISKLSLFSLDMMVQQTGPREVNAVLMAKKIFTYSDNDVRLHLVLTESEIPEEWQETMDELNFVCRNMYPDHKGTLAEFATDSSFQAEFNLAIDESYDISHCELIAFLQDNSSKEVLQTAKFDLATLGIEINEEINLVVCPVPASDKLFVQSEITIRNLSVKDISGREVERQPVDSPSSTLNISELKPGIYFLYVETTKGISVRKFIKS